MDTSFLVVVVLLMALISNSFREDPVEVMREQLLTKFDEWYRHTYEFPSRIILPQTMFEAFKKDMERTGHALTILDIPVEAGDVSEIHFVRR